MKNKYLTYSLLIVFVHLLLLSAFYPAGNICQDKKGSESGIEIADEILNNILLLYDVPSHALLSETYPVNPNNKVTYLADGSSEQELQEVSFLWPFSGMLSGVVTLYTHTNQAKYLSMLEDKILPGLDKYYDNVRLPAAYQSYPTFAGNSDRFYDDNVWLALDFCNLYVATDNKKYLDKATEIYDFVYSGWDDVLNGGIYWCEQNKSSKNTCSNAPGAVLSAKMYNITNDEKYLKDAINTYEWTKHHLLDTSDYVYLDNVSTSGEVDRRKYSYNSGQMIEAAVMLYKITSDNQYLIDAQNTARGSYNYFTSMQKVGDSEYIFYNNSPWFNVILLRGLKALQLVDGNRTYIDTIRDNALYAWNNVRNEYGLFGNSWYSKADNNHKWLLDNACMIELFVELDEFIK